MTRTVSATTEEQKETAILNRGLTQQMLPGRGEKNDGRGRKLREGSVASSPCEEGKGYSPCERTRDPSALSACHSGVCSRAR
eukprot:447073-Hanusia_phi.AAC.1